MSTRLERRYRALLTVLPRWYRADRDEEMVTGFLAGRTGPNADLDAEHGWPGWPETGATLALAVRTRLAGRTGTGELGAAVRLAGLLGLLAGIAVSAATLVDALRAEPVLTLWTLVNASAAAAMVALVRGAWLEAKLLAAVPVLPGLVALAVSFPPENPPWQPVSTAAFLLPTVAAVVFLCAGFTADVRTRPGPRWLWASAGAALAGALLPLLGLDPLAVAPIALLALAAARRSRVWTLAAALSAAALLPHAVLMATLPGVSPWPRWALIALAAVTAATACLGLIVRSRAYPLRANG